MSCQSCQISSRDLVRIGFNANTNLLYITDSREKTVKLVNLIGEEIKPQQQLIPPPAPYSICINSLNIICVFDLHLNSILVLDENFNQKYAAIQFESGTIVNFMTFCNQIPNFLYFTNTIENRVCLVDVENGAMLKQTSLDAPYDIKVDSCHLYVTSNTSYSYTDMTLKTFGKTITGSNCIFVLNKSSFEIVRVIEHKNWLKPKGLHIDADGFIWTTAFKLVKNEDNDNNLIISQSLYLFILNQNGEILNLISLSIKGFSDFFAIERKLFFCAANCLRILKLD